AAQRRGLGEVDLERVLVERHAVDLARASERDVAVADVVADSLRLTLARIAEAAAGARDRADDLTLGERHPRDPPVPLHRAVAEVLEVVGRPLAAAGEAPGAALRAADRAVAVAVGPAAQPVLAHDAEAPAVPPFA